MRAHLNAIIIAVAALGVASAPLSAAEAAGKKRHRVYVCDKSRASANKGTVIGGVSGAVLGGAVAGNGAKTEGAVLGGLVGAVAGHQIAKNNSKRCRYVYRYY